jgi:hypothetical protein
MVGVAELVQPPEYVLSKDNGSCRAGICSLIAIVDARDASGDLPFWERVGLRGSVGMWKCHATNATHELASVRPMVGANRTFEFPRNSFPVHLC